MAIQQAKKLGHPFSMVFALNHHAWLYQFYGETGLVDKFATELLTVSQEYGFPFWEISGLFFKGWVLSQTKKVKSGISQMQKSITAFQATGAGSILPYFMTALAQVYVENKQPKKALQWLKDAEARVQKNGEHFFDAEIYRVKGEALFADDQKNKKRAESQLWRAFETARRQKLKILELRALLNLIKTGARKNETKQLLHEACSWFDQDSDLPELKQAYNYLGKE